MSASRTPRRFSFCNMVMADAYADNFSRRSFTVLERRTQAMKRDGSLKGNSSAGVEKPDIEGPQEFGEEDFSSANEESIPVRIAVPIVPVARLDVSVYTASTIH